MLSFFRRALVCAGVCLCARIVVAQAAGAVAPPFPELFRQAERTAPRLIEARARIDAARGHARQAGAWIDPTFGVEVEDVAGSAPYNGWSQAQTTVSLSEPIELAGQRGARAAAGEAGVRSAERQGEETRLAFGYQLALAYAEAEAAQLHSEVLAEDFARAQEDVRTARALVSAGKEADLRAVQADAAAAAARAEVAAGRAEELSALGKLSSLAGYSEPFERVTPSVLNMRGTPALAAGVVGDAGGAGGAGAVEGVDGAGASHVASVPDRIEDPAVRSAAAEHEAAQRQLDVERKRAIPTPTLSVGTRRFSATDSNAWVMSVSVPLPFFDRNRGGIAAARADVTAAQARLAATKLESEATWRAALAQRQASEARRTAADQSESAAREAYRLVRIGYDAGRTPLIEVLSARRALTEAQSRALEARIARVQAEASLARLAGRIPFAE